MPRKLIFLVICSSQNPAFFNIRFGLRWIKGGIFWKMRAKPIYGSWTLISNMTCQVCVTCTYSSVDVHLDHSHHNFMFHKYHSKHPSKPCKVTDRVGMEAYLRVTFFLFLVCYTDTQLANQLHQTRIQVVRSNKVARKRLTQSNGTPAMDLGHKNVDLK